MQNFTQNIEKESFAAATVPYLNELFRAAVRLTNNRFAAEAAISEVYFQALNTFCRCQSETEMRIRFYKILFRKFGQFSQPQKSGFKIIARVDSLLADSICSSTAAQKLTDEEIILQLKQIPPCFREAMLLADVEGLCCREISEILEIPVETARLHICFGRKILRNRLMNHADFSNAK